MKVFFAAPSVVLVVSVLCLGAFAQSSPDVQPRREPDKTSEQILKDALLDHENRALKVREDRIVNPVVLREDRVVKKGLLAPSQDDRLTFAAFLQMPNTGLLRLLPREVYDSETYSTKKKIDIRGGGAYYSFLDRTHAYKYGSDILLDHNRLAVGFAGADYGILTSLGDVPIEAITLEDPRVQFLSSYQPPTSEPLARAESRRFNRISGAIIDGLRYTSSLPAIEHTTYLLRSIVYDRTDVLVVLRVVRKDTDGSLIIAWKLLKNYPMSELPQNRAR